MRGNSMGNYAYVDATIDFKTTDEKVYEETRALFNEHFPDENGKTNPVH